MIWHGIPLALSPTLQTGVVGTPKTPLFVRYLADTVFIATRSKTRVGIMKVLAQRNGIHEDHAYR